MRMRLEITIGRAMAALCLLSAAVQPLAAAPLPVIKDVEWQPFAAQIRRLIEATDYLGAPFNAKEKKALEAALNDGDTSSASARVQALLDSHCLFGVQINPEMRVKVAQGPAKPELVEKGWRQFLVKIQNDSGATAELRAVSPSALSLFEGANLSPSSSDKF